MLSDRYRLDELVAKGAFAGVYRGFHLKMRKEVAIKVLHPETENFPDLVARFEREAIVGAHIRHPNIAYASDMGAIEGGSCFLVLELVRGRTLRALIEREAPLEPERACRLLKQLASALAVAHEHGVVHRDLKPLNVMVTSSADEQIKLLDFGLARVPLDRVAPLGEDDDHVRISTPGVVFGSVDYMAPEIAGGMDAVDERSDLYSLGVLFYEMLSGKHPFDAGSPVEILAHHRSTPPPPIAKRHPATAVPIEIEAVVMRLLEKDPADRYQDAQALIRALDSIGMRDESSVSVPFTTTPVKPSRRGVAVVGLGAVAAAAIFIGLYTLAKRGEPSVANATEPEIVASTETSASAAPTASAEIDYATALSTDLLAASKSGDAAEGASILVALAGVKKDALLDRDMRAAAIKVAAAVGARGGRPADEVFYALAYRFGSEGLDVLYDVATTAESGKAADRANSILEIQGTSGRASPALRIAVELRRASCREKRLLFDRAAKDGDARTVAVLEKLRPPACDPDGDACCLRHHVGLEKTIEALKAKLGK